MQLLDTGVAEPKILSFCVWPGIGRLGIKMALMMDILGKAIKSSVSNTIQEVDENNTPACQHYERHRFEKVGERKIIEKIKSNGPTVLFSNCRSKI